MKQALLFVNFGTSIAQAQESICAVEESMAYVMPGADTYSCLTSPTIRKKLIARGNEVYSLEEILEKILPMNYDRVIVQPTHLLFGVEYDKIKLSVENYAPKFKNIVLGKPLLNDTEDLQILADCLKELYGNEKEALVLMGHGTPHQANLVYPAFQTILRLTGFTRSYVGTVEGWPSVEDVISQLKADGEKSVLLVPMMLVAGDHALNDMAGDEEDSWKSLMQAEGMNVRCHLGGLGMLPEIQSLYCRHLKKTIENI